MDTYSLLDLALVGLDLLLEFVDHVLESLLALTVLIGLERELLEAAVLLAHALFCLSIAALFIVKFNLELTDLEDVYGDAMLKTSACCSKRTYDILAIGITNAI